MIKNAIKYYQVDNVKIGVASGTDKSNKPYLQVAIIYGPQFNVATSSIFIQMKSLKAAENKVYNLNKYEILEFISKVKSNDPFVYNLNRSLSTVKNNPVSTPEPPAIKPTTFINRSYKHRTKL